MTNSNGRDPIAMANLTVKAVDQIGEATAHEIEETAKTLLAAADEITEKLRRLADAIRQQSRIAGDHVEDFCKQATDVVSTVRELQDRLDGKHNLSDEENAELERQAQRFEESSDFATKLPPTYK